jgi:two-component system sensor histidine kinase RegB
MPLGQGLISVLAVYAFGIALPIGAIALLLGLQALVALLTWMRLRAATPVTPLELATQVHVDILLLAAMLYLTGGTENPFAALFVVPVAIAAASLEQRWVWITVGSTACCCVALYYFRVPLAQAPGSAALHELREFGMMANNVLIALLLAGFIAKVRLEVQRHTRLLADIHNNQMRNDSTLAIRALAAGCAHELSSPLGTIAVVVTELQRERPYDGKLQEHLGLVDQQVRVAKEVVSSLTGAAGQRRAEAAGVASLDHFVRRIVEQAQAVHPGATIRARIGRGEPAPMIVAEETLRQAFANLIDNAVSASACDVHVRAEWSGRDFVFAVCDQGPGFPLDFIDKLADRVTNIGALDRSVFPGLLFTNVTLGRLGGSLTLTNKAQGGARVEVRLPLRAIVC